MSLHYHYPSHSDAYTGGYLSHSVWLEVGSKGKMCIIQEMDAEYGTMQRHAMFINEGMVELLHFKDWRGRDGKFKKRTKFLGRCST